MAGVVLVALAGLAQDRPAADATPSSQTPRLRSRELDIETCLRMAVLYNKSVIKAREEVTRIGGERILNRSRFLPQVSYVFRNEHAVEDDGDDEAETDNENKVRLTQRLFEFGKDTRDDLALRANEREALYALEDAIRDAMYQTRLLFYRILLKQEQVSSRRNLLEEFRQKHERIKARFEKSMVLEVDVLTARLNMLNEELQINNLETEANNLRMQLMQQLGNPIAVYRVTLVGQYEPFSMPVEQCVQIGLDNSTAVALAQEKVNEQRRLIGKLVWEFAPDLSFSAGVQRNDNTASLTIKETEDKVWAGEAAVERYLITPEDGIDTFSYITAKSGWFVTAEASFPIFTGLARRGKYQSERAKLRKLLTDVEIQRDSAEVDIRTAYQNLLQRIRTVEIQAETVRISRERWQIKERLKDIGRVTDDEIETFRDRFFNDQQTFFRNQDDLVQAQEALRKAMRHFR